MARTRVPNAGGRKPTRRPSRVDGIRALDRYTNPGQSKSRVPQRPGGVIPRRPGAPGAPAPGGVGARPPQVPGVPQPAAGGAQPGQHPFIPGGNLAPVVPANVSESGSPPGVPNLSSMVMRSFQPQMLERTPLISNGSGVPPQQPNQNFNFGGGQLPPGQQGMVPRGQQPQGQSPQGGSF